MGLDVTLMPVQKILQDPKRSTEHNTFLKQTGFTLPAGNDKDFNYSEKVGPYAVFHHLWRYAAHLEIRGEPPAEPGTHPTDDACYQQAIAKPETRFDQLLRHSDDTGYYYPINFPNVLTITPETQNQGGLFKKLFGGGSKETLAPVTFGSAVRLLDELLEINKYLNVPVREEVPSETYEDGIHGDEWGDEKWTWVVLYFMSKKAVEHGQIVVFE